MDTPRVGDVFEERFEILDELGRGGFGVVMRARDLQTGQLVAIKYLQPHPGGYPARVAARFAHEVEAMGSLRHPNIVQLVSTGQTAEGLLYLAMELVEGGDLTAARQTRTFTADEVESLVRQLLSALAHTHQKGILHRDIKPSNILIAAQDLSDVKLVDFGIAKLREPIDGRPGLTATGHVVGTPTYMAPELMVGDTAGPSADLYSLGLVAIELLAAPGSAREWHRRATAQHVSAPPGNQRLAEDVGPPYLRRALERMTHGDPRRRASSAAQVLDTIERRDAGRRPPVQAPPEQRSRPHLTMVVAAAMLGILVSVVMVFVLSDDGEQPSRTTTTRPIDGLIEPPEGPNQTTSPPVDDVEPPVDATKPSPGCGKTAPFAGRVGEVRDSYLDPGGWRTLLPSDYDPNHAHPVLFVFHADLFSGKMMIEHLRLEKLADEKQIVVIAPDFPPYPKRTRRAEIARVAEALSAAGKRLCLDPRRIYALGYGLGSDGAEMMAREPWTTAVVSGGYFPAVDDVPTIDEARQIPHLFLATMESAVYPVKGGRSCAFLNTEPRVSLVEHEDRIRSENRCESTRKKIFEEGGDVCYEWTCEARFVSCHLAGGLFWPGSGIRKWPIKNIHGCDVDPTISEFDGTGFAWAFLTTAPPNPPDGPKPW